MWVVFYKYVHGKELNTTNHVFYSPVSCSCKQQIHLAGSLGKPVISEVLILQRSLDAHLLGKVWSWSCCLTGPQGCCKYQVVVIQFLSGKWEFLYIWSQNPIPYIMVGFSALFPGTESSMAIKSQNFQRAYLKDSFLCNFCEYFFFIYSILRSFKRVNMMRYLCQKKNWQEIPYVRSKYSKIKLC